MIALDADLDSRAAWRAAVLKELVEAGMDMVREMRAVASQPDGPDVSVRFGRVAKALRMTLALDAKLCDEAALAAEERVAARRTKHDLKLQTRKVQVHNGLVNCLDRDVTDDDETRKGLHLDELAEEIEHLEVSDEDYLNLPVSQIVAKICEDLGIFVDWHGLRTQDWAMEERKTKPQGSVFANGVPPPIDWDIWDTRTAGPPSDSTPSSELKPQINPNDLDSGMHRNEQGIE